MIRILLLFLTLFAGCSYPSPKENISASKLKASPLFERKELIGKLAAASPKEVRALLGDPDDFYTDVAHFPDDTPGLIWIYAGRTKNPDDGQQDTHLVVIFIRERATKILCRDKDTVNWLRKKD